MLRTRHLSQVCLAALLVVAMAACAQEDEPVVESDVSVQDGGSDVPVSSAGIVINEVASSGDPDDWIELHNGGSESVDLGGWTLTDSDPTHTLSLIHI